MKYINLAFTIRSELITYYFLLITSQKFRAEFWLR